MKNDCGDCHYCCQLLSFKFPGMPPLESIDFYKTRGCVFHYGKDETYVTVNQPCPHLDVGGKSGCSIYEERPAVCRKFDGRENPVTKGKCKLRRKKK